MFLSDDFKDLWEQIKYKTTYVGVDVMEGSENNSFMDCEIIDYELPDIVTYLQMKQILQEKIL